MRTYIDSNNWRIFILDGAETDDTSAYFEKASAYIRKLSNVNIIKYSPAFWDSGILKFEMDNIYMELYWTDFPCGTYLRVNSELSEAKIDKVTKWCEDICRILEERETK
ncbi:MAG: hypothetical protein LBV11_03025 [Bacillus cereus]|jgi:hypothetical protein|nr:hypothetical protein [Bacillus cereus]